MPREFPVELDDPRGESNRGSLVVQLNKLPEKGSWFDLGDGTPAQAREIRVISGEPVIFASLGDESDRPRLREHE